MTQDARRNSGLHRLLVTQPYVPAYRKPLFERLAAISLENGYDLTVVAGAPTGEQASRNDAVAAAWSESACTRRVSTPAGSFFHRSIDRLEKQDIFVTELDPRNLNAWWRGAAARSTRIAWGHGGNYVNRPTKVGMTLKVVLSRSMNGVMTYTPGGATALIRHGADPSSVFAVGNSTDTAELRKEYEALLRLPKRHALEILQVPDAPRFYCYVGGLDSTKRLDFLCQVMNKLWDRQPEAVLLVGGAGTGVAELPSDDRIKYLGHIGPQKLAAVARVSVACLMPGRVGLVGIDMQAAGVPVVTLRSSFHGPEVELLRDGEDIYMTSDDPSDFVDQVMGISINHEILVPPAPVVSIEVVANNFFQACMAIQINRMANES